MPAGYDTLLLMLLGGLPKHSVTHAIHRTRNPRKTLMALRFDDQTVVVTGVSNGLGSLYAIHFASRGANIVVHDHLNKV